MSYAFKMILLTNIVHKKNYIKKANQKPFNAKTIAVLRAD